MKKHLWKILSGVLLLVCLVLAYSVYDAERRVDLFFEKYTTVNQELKQAKKELENVPEIPQGITQISFDGGIAISYFSSVNKAIVVCDFNGDNIEREAAIMLCAVVTACESYNTQDAIAIDSIGNSIMSSDSGKTMFYGEYARYSDIGESTLEKYTVDMNKIW